MTECHIRYMEKYQKINASREKVSERRESRLSLEITQEMSGNFSDYSRRGLSDFPSASNWIISELQQWSAAAMAWMRSGWWKGLVPAGSLPLMDAATL